MHATDSCSLQDTLVALDTVVHLAQGWLFAGKNALNLGVNGHYKAL